MPRMLHQMDGNVARRQKPDITETKKLIVDERESVAGFPKKEGFWWEGGWFQWESGSQGDFKEIHWKMLILKRRHSERKRRRHLKRPTISPLSKAKTT